MRARTLLIALFAGLGCGAHAKAERCPDLYAAIKHAAMYCDFFCDQRKLVPLQKAYEENCIAIVVPLRSLSFENLPDEAGLKYEEATKPRTSPN